MSKKSIVKGTTGYFFKKFFTRILGFLFVVLCTRIVGPEGYGLIALGFTVRGLVSNLGIFGFGFYSQKQLSGKITEKKQQIMGTMLIINFILSILLFLIFFFGNNFIAINIFNKIEFAPVLKIFSISILFTVPYNLMTKILKSQKKVLKIFLSSLAINVIKLLSLGLVFVLDSEILATVWAVLISAIAGFVISIYFILTEKLYPIFNKWVENYKTVLKSGLEFLIVGLGYYFAAQTDRLMLGVLSTAKALGIYAIASAISKLPRMVHSSMVNIFMPIIADIYRDKNYNKLEKTYYFSNVLVAGINFIFVSGIIVFGKEIFIYVFDVTTLTSYYILVLLTLRVMWGVFIGPAGALLNMADKHKIEFVNTSIFIILNIILNYFLIKQFGIYGAVFATIISSFLLDCAQIIEVYKFYKLKIFKKFHYHTFTLFIGFLIINFTFVSNTNLLIKISYFFIINLIFGIIFWNVLSGKRKKYVKEKIEKFFKK